MRLYIVEFDRQITYTAVLVGITSVSCNMCVQLYMTTSPSSTAARLYTMLRFVLIQPQLIFCCISLSMICNSSTKRLYLDNNFACEKYALWQTDGRLTT